ncbi:unnamed protein product [Victoria cruziana]
MAKIRRSSCFCLLLLPCLLVAATAETDPDDATALESFRDTLRDTAPPSWGKGDPCAAPWDGVFCTDSRVTGLMLSSMGLESDSITDIGSLAQLERLDLSSNRDLTGSIPPSIGNLANLKYLYLQSCDFSGSIPDDLGKLGNLTHLALNDNQLTGFIPQSFGNLSNIYWLDFADNRLSGPLPISSGGNPGLDNLLKAQHFHFSRNRLSGTVPPTLFSPQMVLKHILFDGNNFSGPIPPTIGDIITLEALRLDRNSFDGTVPASLGDLTRLSELNLANNKLTGPLPNLTRMDGLQYVDLSNNSFNDSVAPPWFTTLESLTTLVLENGELGGNVPEGLFSLSSLRTVKLKYNLFGGTLDMGDMPSGKFYVDLENNRILHAPDKLQGNVTLKLGGNPFCEENPTSPYCSQGLRQPEPYSTSLGLCGNSSAPCRQPDEKLHPYGCRCAYPYRGVFQFRAIHFSDMSNASAFQALEEALSRNLNLGGSAVYLEGPHFDVDGVVQLNASFFPSTGEYFNRTQIIEMGFDLGNHTYRIPPIFGPYVFVADPYPFSDKNGGNSLPLGAVAAIVVGACVLVFALLALAVYAIRQRRRPEKATEGSRPFASWGGTSGKGSRHSPQLKGARWFSYDEIKKYTDGFSSKNEIGSGGYGKVYRGTLPNGQLVAIKRATQGSMQGGLEFKTEIELLSRVHHKNLVSLVGFCLDRGEQMVVYEFVPKGTLRDSLSGRSGILLDWKRRLRVSLGSARGLAYLHELANPPIIHRDVKTTNILLDVNLVAKVADFGLSKLIADSAKGHVSTQVKGTMGYLDPEYYMSQQLTEKSDVYSFGVVMLELITAQPPITRGKHIVREVRSAIDKRKEACGLGELLDPAIRGVASPGFAMFLDLAMSCVEESASDRPTMGEVVKEIEAILQNEAVASASSSANDSGTSKGAPPRHHPYNDPLPAGKDHWQDSDEFSHSGAYTVSNKIEPK